MQNLYEETTLNETADLIIHAVGRLIPLLSPAHWRALCSVPPFCHTGRSQI
jgi:hypothetical protein